MENTPSTRLSGHASSGLRAPKHRRAQIFVKTRLKSYGMLCDQRLLAPEFLIKSSKRRSTVARYKAAGIHAGNAIAASLLNKNSHECLRTCRKNRAALASIAVLKTVRYVELALNLDCSHINCSSPTLGLWDKTYLR
jgi:hypothetical protein